MLGKAIIFKAMEIRACQIARQVGELACDEIKETMKNAKPLPWPPTIYSFLRSSDRKPPKVLTMHLKILLSESHGKPSASRDRLVDSGSHAVLFSVSRGSFQTLGHMAMGLGRHSLTGQKLPLVITSHVGHCITYDLVYEIETAQAELPQELNAVALNLPLLSSDRTQKIIGTFWWDNFDRTIARSCGSGSVHNTPRIVFQHDIGSVIRQVNLGIPRTKRRSLKLVEAPEVSKSKVNPKQNPPSFADKNFVPADNKKLLENQSVLL